MLVLLTRHESFSVFDECNIIASPNAAANTTGATVLGRPWKEFGRVVFRNSWIGDHLDVSYSELYTVGAELTLVVPASISPPVGLSGTTRRRTLMRPSSPSTRSATTLYLRHLSFHAFFTDQSIPRTLIDSRPRVI